MSKPDLVGSLRLTRMTCSTKIEILADQILQKLPGLSTWRYRFLLRLFVLWPAMLGRRNFVYLGRQGEYTDFTYRKHFTKRMDWLALRIYRWCGIDPNLPKMKSVLAEVRNYAARAA